MKCYHCGDICLNDTIAIEQKHFCCTGCMSVYQILNNSGLSNYYQIEAAPGVSKKNADAKQYDFIENESISEQLITFKDDEVARLQLYLPTIHCSSCIWLLENLSQLVPAVKQSRVDFVEKTCAIVFDYNQYPLQELLTTLDQIGYPPDLVKSIELKTKEPKEVGSHRKLLYKIAVAGFCFGNIMLLSFPEYVDSLQSLDSQFENLFRYLSLALSLPVLLYSSSDYLVAAFKSIKAKSLNIDVPISLGIITLFVKSVFDVAVLGTHGYFDSLAGLVFFLLIGKWFQERTYNSLSFDRNYKSFFPLAYKVLEDDKEVFKTIDEIHQGDLTIIRNGEVVPADSVLLSSQAVIDYSFVTGESNPVVISEGKTVFAGGQVQGAAARILLNKEVSNSYLVGLWNERESGGASHKLSALIDDIARNFTIAIISIALIGGLIWWFLQDAHAAIQVFASVLIVACPCALSLAFPFTFGHVIKYFGKNDIYLKNINVVERMAKITDIIFDKTGTITNASKAQVSYLGESVTSETLGAIATLASYSTHPLSRMLYDHLRDYSNNTIGIASYQEYAGKGMTASANNNEVMLGSASFLMEKGVTGVNDDIQFPRVHLAINQIYQGVFVMQNEYREQIFTSIQSLQDSYQTHILSGDADYEYQRLKQFTNGKTEMRFNQNPKEKQDYIAALQSNNSNVAMIGDGLNDAGALLQSEVGISVIDKIGSFSPASDIIIEGRQLNQIDSIFQFAKNAKRLLHMGLLFSLTYNLIGLIIALSGKLTPVIAAILMPLSSITVVAFVVFGVWLLTKLNPLK